MKVTLMPSYRPSMMIRLIPYLIGLKLHLFSLFFHEEMKGYAVRLLIVSDIFGSDKTLLFHFVFLVRFIFI
jgi:hypothetical protein